MRTFRSVLALLAGVSLLSGYSVLSHEALVDSAWEDGIKPLLLKRFPSSSEEEMRKARAYVYGGCLIQDMGYYPLGSKFFSDLTHYTRSGDFIEALIREAQDLNEYAFALGALAHHSADNKGHPLAVNKAVAILYPKLRAKYGNNITYAQHPVAHMKTEFGFDVVQVVKGRYAPQAYHDFIGFEVADKLLERVFPQVYGLEIEDIFGSFDVAVGTYRFASSTLIPEATKIAWKLKHDDLVKSNSVAEKDFVYHLSRRNFEKEWGTHYEKPGVMARFLAFVFRVLPKVGPLSNFGFKASTPETEKMFMESFNRSLDGYRASLRDVANNRLHLSNTDFDTGRQTRAGEYELADRAYAKLLKKLADHRFEQAPPEMRRDILAFYRDLEAPISTKKKPREWRKVLVALQQLRQMQGSATASAGSSSQRFSAIGGASRGNARR